MKHKAGGQAKRNGQEAFLNVCTGVWSVIVFEEEVQRNRLNFC
jgi:hypothetical protein